MVKVNNYTGNFSVGTIDSVYQVLWTTYGLVVVVREPEVCGQLGFWVSMDNSVHFINSLLSHPIQ